MIRFDNVSKIYSTDVVLKNINWEIRKGEKIGLVGSNGAGKSTQFKILIGEEDQTSGLVLKEGSPKICHLKQELDCNLNRTVREELESSFKDIQVVSNKLLEIENELKFLETCKDSEKLVHLVNQLAKFQEKFEVLGGYQMQAEVEKILPKLGFSQEDADKLVGNFSGGWQMKVALGKIILQKPDLLLLDEPTNHLDLETIFWLGPDEWLIISNRPANSLQLKLREALRGHIAVTDVSGGYTKLRLVGPSLPSVLQKASGYDFEAWLLDDTNQSRCAQTNFAKATALVALNEDNSFDVVVRRSFADYIAQWLLDAGRVQGCLIHK